MSRIPHIQWDRVRWDLVAGAAVIAIIIGAAVIWLPRMFSSTVKTSSEWAGTAGEAATKAADVAVAAAPAVKNALVTAERAARRQSSATTNRPATTSGPGAQAPSAAVGGFLLAFSRIPMDLFADGRRIGTTEDGQLLLSAGSHKIEFVSQRFNFRSTVTLTIRPGQVTAHTLALPSGRVRVTTSPGAEVWIEGERAGVAPLDAMPVTIGTREVVVKDAAFGERRQSVEVKNGETTELTIMPGSRGPATAPRLAPLSQ
jgi:hypothetical protein